MEADKVESHGAVAGQVERSVRPRAWAVRQGARTYYVTDAEFVRSSYDYGEFVPLYGPEALDAVREQCAAVCEAEHVGASLYATDLEPSDVGYNIALQHAAASIRGA
jgi:hypothetical protein